MAHRLPLGEFEDLLPRGVVHEESQIDPGSRRVLSDVTNGPEAEPCGQLPRRWIYSYNCDGDEDTVRCGHIVSQLQRPLISFVNVPPKPSEIGPDETEADHDT